MDPVDVLLAVAAAPWWLGWALMGGGATATVWGIQMCLGSVR